MERDSCLKVVMRFIAQKSQPSTNISDNDSQELPEYDAAWNKEVVKKHLIRQEIRWKFNPPVASPIEKAWSHVVGKQFRYCWGTDQTPWTFFQRRSVLWSKQ